MNNEFWLIGAGPIAIAHAQVLKELGAQPTVVGRGDTSAATFVTATGLAVRPGGLTEWLGKNPTPATMAVLAIDIEETAAAAMTLMDYGVRRILVEKPGGVDAAEIAAVARRANQTGSQVFLAYNRRFLASVRRARDVIMADGGITSFNFEFTEQADRVAATPHSARVKANWFLANSTHVVDLAFFLGGAPQSLIGEVDGQLAWHAPAKFAGYGRSTNGALFHYGADWTSIGSWSVRIHTPRRQLILRPLETLQAQEIGKIAIEAMSIDDSDDKRFKPGFLAQMQAFLNGHDTDLADIDMQDDLARGAYATMLRGGSWSGTTR